MTKVVYNACFGGFGLSPEAVKRYGEIKGLNLVCIDNLWYRDGIKDEEHYFSVFDIEEDRTDPALVQVVEELGVKANDWAAKLRIAEVEEGQRYRIDEYDGRECVMTVDDYDWNVA